MFVLQNSARKTFPGTFEKNIRYEHMNDFQTILNTFTLYVCALKTTMTRVDFQFMICRLSGGFGLL